MSLEKDITGIMEAEIFQPASPEDRAARKSDYENKKAEEMFYQANKAYPGLVDKLRKELGNEALVQTVIAYADSDKAGKIIGIKDPDDIRDLDWRGIEVIRNLDWTGIWTDAKTFIEQCKIVNVYNNFDVAIAKAIVKYFGPGLRYRLGREGSVSVYVKPVTQDEFDMLNRGLLNPDEEYEPEFGEDEISLEGNELRMWWD